MVNINLTSSMRNNLLSLQNTQSLMDVTQQRLSTGLKINSAIDNPSSYYTAVSLTNRASDLSALLDSMGQSVQILKITNEALTYATNLLTQAKAIANEALENDVTEGIDPTPTPPTPGKTIDDFIAEGYKVITTEEQLKINILDGAKLVLANNIILNNQLVIDADSVTIDGFGSTLTYSSNIKEDDMIRVVNANVIINDIKLIYSNTSKEEKATAKDGGSAIMITGAGNNANITNIIITTDTDRTHGIRVMNGASLKLDNTLNIKASGVGSFNIVNGNAELYDGYNNTQAIRDSGINSPALAAVDSYNVAGNYNDWYLPAVGELRQLYDNKTIIMTGLYAAGGSNLGRYSWSSSEVEIKRAWRMDINDGSLGWTGSGKDDSSNMTVRAFQIIKNINKGDVEPQIGNIVYSDGTYSSGDECDSYKTAIGIVTNVSDDKSDVTIMALKNASSGTVKWEDTSDSYTDIDYIVNHNASSIESSLTSKGTIAVSNTISSTASINTFGYEMVENVVFDNIAIDYSSYYNQYSSVLNQYNSLINDANYRGINLLMSGNLTTNFNEGRTSKLNIYGVDAGSIALGLTQAKWESLEDIQESIKQISSAINQLRRFAQEFGNYNSIIQTREDFTNSLINILTEGADKLTLADMNEESANMLAFQSRQQLAINSLSLASQASQSILRLF